MQGIVVSIHPMCRFKEHHHKGYEEFTPFQYIPMCRFKDLEELSIETPITVSIHPMCRFKFVQAFHLFAISTVSIHPMCRFKCFYWLLGLQYQLWVSIHPMCRFKLLAFELNHLCLVRFNTSYVSVQEIFKSHCR